MSNRWIVPLVFLVGALFNAQAEARAAQQETAPTRHLVLEEFEHLPLGRLLQVLEELELRRHSSSGVALAYYQPFGTGSELLGLPESQASRGRLWLRSGLVSSPPSGGNGGALVQESGEHASLSLLNATPDIVEPLAYSMLLARLHARYDREPRFAQVVRDRALSAFAPEGVRPPANERPEETSRNEHLAAEYLMASASFGAHILTLANDLERAQERRLASGRKGLCAQLKEGLGLFDFWRVAFEGEAFPATTFAEDGGQRTRNVTRQHRLWVIETLLPDSGWNGDLTDHARFCEDTEAEP